MIRKTIPVLGGSALLALIALLTLSSDTRAANEDTFLKILDLSYQASCRDAERLRDFYLPEAEIIHDGRQTTLNETIDELHRTLSGLKGLVCTYKPRPHGSYIEDTFAFMTLRESIHISAEEMNPVEIRQICTYIFLKKKGKWMITHDHCSEVEGQTV